MSTQTPPSTETTAQTTEMREFMLVVRRALLLIVHFIDERYPPAPNRAERREQRTH